MTSLLSRLLLAAALIWLPLADASAAVVQITVKDGGGTSRNINVTTATDATGNLSWNNVICDQSAGATCASVGTAGSPSTNALTIQGVTLGHGTAANAMRVELPTDGTGVVGLIAGTAIVGKVGLDQTTPGTTNAIALSTLGANAVSTGNGVAGTGVMRVAIASDNTANSNPWLVNPGTLANWAIGATGAAVPANAQLTGGTDTTNTRAFLTDAAGRQNIIGGQPASTTMQNGVTANGNGSNLTVTNYGVALVNVNCSVACSGGTTINFEGTDSTGTFFSVAGYPIGGGAAATTAITSGQFLVPVTGLTSLRARVSGYSAGTITVTGTAFYGTFPAVSAAAAGGTSSTFGSAFPATGTAIGLTSGTNMVAWSATTNYGTAPAAIPVPAANVYVTNSNNNGPAAASASSPVTLPTANANFVLEPAASDNHAVIVNGSGHVVYGIQVFNNSATVNYGRLYNAGTGFNGCNSATNLVYEFHIPASTSDAGFVVPLPNGLDLFSSGISVCVTGAYGQTSTTNATATAISLNINYR